jgi:AcrR family transcriptional regulator
MSSRVQTTKAAVVSDFRRRQILSAARQSFTRRGVTHTTMDAIARAAHVAKGTVYLYYRSKDEVLHQILTEDLAELQDDALRCLKDAGTLDERLPRYLHAVISFFDRRRDFIEHCQFEMSPAVSKKAKQRLGQVFATMTEAWTRVLADEADRGAIATADAAATARSIVSLAHGISIQRLKGWQTNSLESAVSSATSLVLQGMAPR